MSSLRLSVCLSVAVLGACNAGQSPQPDDGADASADWKHYRVRLEPPGSDSAVDDPRDFNLTRPLSPQAVDGESGWWLGYLDETLVESLRERGLQVVGPIEVQSSETPSETPDIGAQRAALSTVEPLSPDGPCPDATPDDDTFCAYEMDIGRCERSIYDELLDLSTDYPPSPNDYVEAVYLGTTDGGPDPAETAHHILAARVGAISDGSGSFPQLVIVGGQHAREWIGVELAMRTLRHFAEGYRDGDQEIVTLLSDRTLTVLPVANPDGYEWTHMASVNRGWRPNRRECEPPEDPGIGVDPNRNFPFAWGEPGADGDCASTTYRGLDPSTDPELETSAQRELFGHDLPSGKYRTGFVLNNHAYGNFVLLPEGFSSSFDPCTTDSNCSAPDLGLHYTLLGTENPDEAWLRDEDNDRPYIVGSTFRSLYAASGNLHDDATYGSWPGTGPSTAPAASLELTHTNCGFRAEAMDPADIDDLFDNIYLPFVTHLLENIDALEDGSYYTNTVGDHTLPHLHRHDPDSEHPTVRVAVRKSLSPVDIAAPPGWSGTDGADHVIDGHAYAGWFWRPDTDPYEFPTRLQVCAQQQCDIFTLGPDSSSVDLCDPGRFTENGWSHVGDLPGGPQRECYWELDQSGPSPWQLELKSGSLSDMEDARLVYSFEQTGTVGMKVYVSDNGFSSCSLDTGTGCRLVAQYPYDTSIERRDDGKYRTEILDVSDFDGSTDVQVLFDMQSAGSGAEFRIYDTVIIGWET